MIDLLRADQADAAAQTLSDAFQTDPLLYFFQPDARKRPEFGRWMFTKMVDYGLRWGRVYADEDASAAAFWLPPGETNMTTGRMIRVGLWAMPFKAGLRSLPRFLKLMSMTEKWHKEAVQGPHWYLGAIGTQPSLQGKGLGSALVEAGTSQADAAGLPCYLETGTDQNVVFYSKRGFEVVQEAEMYGFHARAMVRQPR